MDGNNPDCSKSVHVAQNSWGLSLGGGDYKAVLDVWHAVGIMPIFANGNYGPTCAIVYSPAGTLYSRQNACPLQCLNTDPHESLFGTEFEFSDNIGAIGVGATDSDDRLAYFSGRGPSEFGILKPDYSAPGKSMKRLKIKANNNLL